MGIAVRKHNARVRRKNWWLTYFWSKHEYWAKFAVHNAAHRAKVAKLDGERSYFFWNRVCLRAAAFCERKYGPVPELLVRRPIRRSVWALSSPEVGRWLRVQSPYLKQASK